MVRLPQQERQEPVKMDNLEVSSHSLLINMKLQELFLGKLIFGVKLEVLKGQVMQATLKL